MSKKV